MTNSEADAHNTNTGSEDQTSPATDKFISNKGTEFRVDVLPNGLFHVKMLKGGATPTLCDELFTSRSAAETALSRYILSGAKITGVAQVPQRVKSGKIKTQ